PSSAGTSGSVEGQQQSASRRRLRFRNVSDIFLDIFAGAMCCPFFKQDETSPVRCSLSVKFLYFDDCIDEASQLQPREQGSGIGCSSSSAKLLAPDTIECNFGEEREAELRLWKRQQFEIYEKLDPECRAALLQKVPGFRDEINKRLSRPPAGAKGLTSRRSWIEMMALLEANPHHRFAVRDEEYRGRQPKKEWGEDGAAECDGKEWLANLGHWVVVQRR
ncbi:unnamed protein product, partial [Amoebophrya sp. A25]